MNELIPIQIIENKILIIRGMKVMFDKDLAALYEIETGALNRAVKRNLERFPDFFMFQLTEEEFNSLRCQFGISKTGKGGRRYLPYVFTEHGVLMLSSVLNSKKAIAVNIQIMQAFIKLREMALLHKDMTKRLDELEDTFIKYAKDMNINIEDIYRQLNYLTDRTRPSKIGFITKD